ncbi:hypothetical protein BC936DRAFT_149381 [Jimgerdemannia flammicorona]|uniref:Uncharacterized protein n=1 Tax=Jimgerdemannia flammicorona TaxID=994334 RepID=A0A433D0Y3_9FUNG|nr:hypothetical protein BC936DRAFT_149381 [Jimgerdemannia flammicorona]
MEKEEHIIKVKLAWIETVTSEADEEDESKPVTSGELKSPINVAHNYILDMGSKEVRKVFELSQ